MGKNNSKPNLSKRVRKTIKIKKLINHLKPKNSFLNQK
jgi:hypothetical protein